MLGCLSRGVLGQRCLVADSQGNTQIVRLAKDRCRLLQRLLKRRVVPRVELARCRV